MPSALFEDLSVSRNRAIRRSYFSRVFLKYYKETPGNWVKRNTRQ